MADLFAETDGAGGGLDLIPDNPKFTFSKLASSQMPTFWIAIEMHDGTDTNNITLYYLR